MKTWAISMGATHYTHCVSAFTGATAEKPMLVLTFNGRVGMEKFGGWQLGSARVDASSFPNGGIANPLKQGLLQAWDTTSPAIFNMVSTLCYTQLFVAYTGEALITRAPLFKKKNNWALNGHADGAAYCRCKVLLIKT